MCMDLKPGHLLSIGIASSFGPISARLDNRNYHYAPLYARQTGIV
jgi:hypothetical protein